MAFVRAALIAGAGVGVLPSFLAAPAVTAGQLVSVLPRLSSPAGAILLVRPAGGEAPPKVRAFTELLEAALQGGAGGL
jgi:DNA-binding transcriptional LysR family regulator